VVTLHSPKEKDFSGKTLEEVVAWCVVWLMTPELGSDRSTQLGDGIAGGGEEAKRLHGSSLLPS
jgi:hypothetical protein